MSDAEFSAFLTADTSPVALFERFEGRGYDETRYARLIIRSGIPTGEYYSHLVIERFREGDAAGSVSFADLQDMFDGYGYFKAGKGSGLPFFEDLKKFAESVDDNRLFRFSKPWRLSVLLQFPGWAKAEEKKYLITGAVPSVGKDLIPSDRGA